MISLGACVAFLYRTRRSALLTPWERQEMADQVSETLDTLFMIMMSLCACVAFLYRTKRSALLTPWERQEMADQVSETLDTLFAEPAYDKRLR